MVANDNLIEKNLTNIYVYFLLGPSIFLWHFLDRFKFIYALPFLFVAIVFCVNLFTAEEKKITYKTKNLYVLFGYILLCTISIVLNINQIKWEGINRDILIFSTPLIIYGYNLKYEVNHIKYLLFIAIASYFSIVGLDSEFSIHLSLFTTSGANNEFHAGVLFGLFLIFFVLKRNYFWVILSIIFILLASKRAIFLGLIPAFGLYHLVIKPFRLLDKDKNWILFLFLFSFYFILYPISINIESFSSWILSLVSDSSTTNFLMKREVFVELLNSEIFSGNLVDFLFGHAPGQADLHLQSGLPGFMNYLIKSPINPHNEYCKLHYDIGIIGVFYFFFMAYTMYINNTKIGVMIFLFTIPTFLVDNPLIFIYYSHIANILVNIKGIENE